MGKMTAWHGSAAGPYGRSVFNVFGACSVVLRSEFIILDLWSVILRYVFDISCQTVVIAYGVFVKGRDMFLLMSTIIQKQLISSALSELLSIVSKPERKANGKVIDLEHKTVHDCLCSRPKHKHKKKRYV